MAVRHIVQEIVLVLVITVISITAALFIANSVQSKPLRIKNNQWHHQLKVQPIIKGANSGDIRLTEVKLNKKLK